MKKYFTWRTNLIFYIVIIFIANLLLISLPLTKVFGYEFAAANAAIITLLSGLYALHYFKVKEKQDDEIEITFLLKSICFLLSVPALVGIINSLFTGFCSFIDGALFYLIITVPSALVGISIGLTAHRLVRKFRIVLYILIFTVILLIAFFEIYFNPQVYLFNPVFGYFPGTIYDEAITVNWKIFSYRFLNLIYFSALLFILKRSISLSKILVTLLIAIIFHLLSPAFGYSTTNSSLRSLLPKKVETENFTTYFANDVDDDLIRRVALNQEFYYNELIEFFKEKPEKKTTCYFFNNSNQKKELLGSGSADVAKPWLNQIYISSDSWEHTLKHEIAHCFTKSFGAGIFRLAGDFNPALIEGIAEAADGFYDENSIDYLAFAAYVNGYEVNLENLFSGFNFFGNTSGLSYVYAGSFTKFLIEFYGIQKFKNYYRTNDFINSYGTDFNNIAKEYFRFLKEAETGKSSDAAKYYFGRKALISKTCPRVISDLINEGWEHISNKDFSGASKRFEKVISLSDNYHAYLGFAYIYDNTDSLSAAIKILKIAADKFEGTSYSYSIKLRLADLFVKTGETAEAESLYIYLVNANPNRYLSNLGNLRLELSKNDSSLIKYVKGSDYDKYFILKELNHKQYTYCSFPVLTNLSERLNEDYSIFLQQFDKKMEVTDFTSSYGVLKLAEYMMQHFDYKNARKMAGLSLRYSSDSNLMQYAKSIYSKAEWLHSNSAYIINKLKITKTQN